MIPSTAKRTARGTQEYSTLLTRTVLDLRLDKAYIPARRLSQLERRYRLKPSADANLILQVIDGPWPFALGQHVLPRLGRTDPKDD
jgi:hypothetical protein